MRTFVPNGGDWPPPADLAGMSDEVVDVLASMADDADRRPQECSDPAGERCKCPCHQEQAKPTVEMSPSRIAAARVRLQSLAAFAKRPDSLSGVLIPSWADLETLAVLLSEDLPAALDELERLIDEVDDLDARLAGGQSADGEVAG